MKVPVKVCLLPLLILLTVSCSDSGKEAPEATATAPQLTGAELGGYSHGIVVKDMRFLWRLREDSLDIKLAAPTKGWVAVGFAPDGALNMKGADLVIGSVRAGKVEVFDHYGTMKDKHQDDERLGGKSDISNVSGLEADGVTEVQFTLPLNSGDDKDRPIGTGDNTVLLAYGRSDRIVLKHTFRAVLTLDLSTGRHTVVKMK